MNGCETCGREIPSSRRRICPSCVPAQERLAGGICEDCGSATKRPGRAKFCRDCIKRRNAEQKRRQLLDAKEKRAAIREGRGVTSASARAETSDPGREERLAAFARRAAQGRPLFDDRESA